MIVSQAMVIGRSHRLVQGNGHDFVVTGSVGEKVGFGVVLDGCGGKYREEQRVVPSSNEVGAKLLGQFIAAWLTRALKDKKVDLAGLPQKLYEACVGFLEQLITLFPFEEEIDKRCFMGSQLLCTVVGFVVQRDRAIFFWRGDGYLFLQGEITCLDSNNAPNYITYDLHSGQKGFEVKVASELKPDDWLGVATDGWQAELLTQLAEPSSTLQLQRRLNIKARGKRPFRGRRCYRHRVYPMKKVYINKQKISLDPAQLIQSGGEGIVFQWGQRVIKLYHGPQQQQAQKLAYLRQNIVPNLPPWVLGPGQIVQDKKGHVIGFEMARLPVTSLPFKQLAGPRFWQKQQIDTENVLQLLQHTHNTLSRLHQTGIVVGDLNDHNLFFEPQQWHSWWIDVDSYQFDQYPCPVGQINFLDPYLYSVTDFSTKPHFTTMTDWYAFCVLLMRCLLQVHPYGGVHRTYKSLTARAEAKVAIWEQGVTYPQRARPFDSLSDELLHHLHLIFTKGKRVRFPDHLLAHLAVELVTCKQCSLTYWGQRPGCPACQHTTPVKQLKSKRWRWLLRDAGLIEAVGIEPSGRLLAIVRQGTQYLLVRLGIGGEIRRSVLFEGQTEYHCSFWGHYLVVNPSGTAQLLVLDVSHTMPKQVTMLESAMFGTEAVWATTPNHLYRIAGGWILRGSLERGHYVEDSVATAHKAQTQLFGSPYKNVVAGYHRVFAETHFFLLDERNKQVNLAVQPLADGVSVPETAVTFGLESVALIRHVKQQREIRVAADIFSLTGTPLHQQIEGIEMRTINANHYPFTSNPLLPSPPFIRLRQGVDEDIQLYRHPEGTLWHMTNGLAFESSRT